MADNGWVAEEHLTNLDLATPDEGELVRDRAGYPHPEVGLLGDERAGDEAPAADEVAIQPTSIDIAEFVAIVHHGCFSVG